MLRIERYSILLLTLTLSFSADAQTDEERDIIERSIEFIAEGADNEDLDYTTLIDDLTYFIERPLDLNRAGFEELSALRLLSDIEIQAILNHREQYGAMIGLEELQSIPNLSMDAIRRILPFVKVKGKVDDLRISRKEICDNSDQELFFRTDRVLEERDGYRPATTAELEDNPNARYLGSPWRYYMRYRFRYQNKISVGFTAEKDGGEEFFKGTQKNGFDFYSAHAFIAGFGKVEKLAIGDYQALMGQGLVLWSGLGFGKSMDLLTLKRNPRGITPYRSVNENLFFRGAAVTLRQDRFRLTLLYSDHNRDGNVLTGDTLDAEEALAFSSLQLTGFHRTPRELEDRKSVNEKVAAAELTWRKGGLSVGARGMRFQYSKALDRDLRPYSTFAFEGDRGGAIGVDYDYVKSNLNLFGEIARSENGAISYVNGAYLVMDPRVTFAAFHRGFDRDFQNPYALAVAESSTPINENGLLMGVMTRPAPRWQVAAWLDRFRFPWLRFNNDAPAGGWEMMSQVTYKPNRSSEFYVRYRHRERPRNSAEETIIDLAGQTMQNNLRLNLRYSVSESVSMRSRIEWTDYAREGADLQEGIMLYHDIIYRPKNSPVDLSMRYVIFDTDGFDSRLYAFEQDVLYFYSIPALSGTGSRYYIVGRYNVKKGVDFWVKWSRWHYLDRDVISSGLDEIQGPIRSDIRMQLRLQF
jgi:hypothetical protein